MNRITPQQWSAQLHEALAISNQRLIVDCAGDLSWCQQVAQDLTQNQKSLVLSEQNIVSSLVSIPFNKSIQLLGQEFNVVIYDAFSGFDVDAFARAIGLIKAPGLLVLLRPDDDQWLKRPDPKNIWQNKQQGNHYFLNYLQKQLYQSDCVLRYHQNKELCLLTSFEDSPKTVIHSSTLLSEQQQLAWNQLNSVFTGSNKSLALLAARGRGKSTLLGRWMKQKALSSKQFIVTSDSKKAAGHCLVLIQDIENVVYMSMDNILLNKPHADCIIVDEAATIPVALLFELKRHYSKVIYTSTLEGYEGTGQGFDLQFLSSFNNQTLKIIELTDPMRWGQKDLLEKWVQKSLMIETIETIESVSNNIVYQQISQLQLSEDDNALSQIFHLLKSAHYRTKASDLKMLLDNPDITLFIARANTQIIGVMLLLNEGGLDAALSNDIYYGKRRPQGHLLAQGLTVHAGCEGFAELKGLRVQRIAVAECYRHQGIGSHLIQMAIDYATQQKLAYVGAVFALDEQNNNFWQKNKMTLMMISVGQGTSTGKPSITMLLSLDPKSEHYKNSCQKSLKASFSERLLTHFKIMPASQVVSLLYLMPALGFDNAKQCDTYINGFKGFEYSLADLRPYVLFLLQQKECSLSVENKSILIKSILQNQSWVELIKYYALSGKKELNQKLKSILK